MCLGRRVEGSVPGEEVEGPIVQGCFTIKENQINC